MVKSLLQQWFDMGFKRIRFKTELPAICAKNRTKTKATTFQFCRISSGVFLLRKKRVKHSCRLKDFKIYLQAEKSL